MTQSSVQPVKIFTVIEIAAPADKVFSIIATCERRLQFHSRWGTEKILHVSSDFPAPASRYSLQAVGDESAAYDTVVTAFTPDREFAYHTEDSRQSQTAWKLEECPAGVRLTYEEEYLPDNPEPETEEANQDVVLEVKDWLNNIKRYCELGEARTHRMMKWLLDRHLLKMRADQRRIIFALLALQTITIISFIAAALGLGIMSLIL